MKFPVEPFQGKGANIKHLEQTQTKMKEFNARRKIKAGAHVVIAATDLLKKIKISKESVTS